MSYDMCCVLLMLVYACHVMPCSDAVETKPGVGHGLGHVVGHVLPVVNKGKKIIKENDIN